MTALLLLTIARAAGLETSKEFYEFERPVLEVVHGIEAITEDEDNVPEDSLHEFDALSAHNLLVSRYGAAAVGAAYPGGERDLARQFGLTVPKRNARGGVAVQASQKVRPSTAQVRKAAQAAESARLEAEARERARSEQAHRDHQTQNTAGTAVTGENAGGNDATVHTVGAPVSTDAAAVKAMEKGAATAAKADKPGK